MVSPPIENALITFVEGTIVEIKPAGTDPVQAIDLGDVAVLPKLVNAHTHLEFSDCESPIGTPGIALADWIGEVMRARGQTDLAARQANIAKGLAESVAGGVGLIADIATTPSTYPPLEDFAVQGNPVRIVSFAEILGLSSERGDERFQSAVRHCDSLDRQGDRCQPAISPHAPYSTPIDLVRRGVELASHSADGMLVAMHLAESPEERELLANGTGRFAEVLKNAGLWRDGLFPVSATEPILEYLRILASAPRSLAVHGNDFRADEIDFLAQNPSISVVYCPRTHAFFGYDVHPVDRLLRSGVRVALGTDSRASNPDLSLWEELRFLLNRRQDLDPIRVLEMATIMGAEAIGMDQSSGVNQTFGRIEAGNSGVGSLFLVPTRAATLNGVYADFARTETSQLRFCTATDPIAGHNGAG
ncbi:hypothetical protein CGZ80_05660 [Rhodopirellula sp. MGV]|nr:hypothetical protein CGZ80_05660 [Rhodopirellula sp. MGV]PNY33854.1 chlorohydrolase [Rhodopirellula baltica]